MPDLHPRTAIGAVHLTIADLERSVEFYRRHLGFAVHDRRGDTVWCGAGGPPLLVLTEDRAARPRQNGTTGLYHFAILVPTRIDLARGLRNLIASNSALDGFADHGVSEAIYLADPDGNGIELYRDRPRAEWPRRNGHLHMGTGPLDTEGLLDELSAESSTTFLLPAGTVIGHVHLHVRDLAEAEYFYAGVLGFDVMQRYGRAALFVSAGGYHHHVGLNTWAGVGAPPPAPESVG
ncbi:MAG TPA: VOC family protein, partial [Vicinamibacterales bacterium]|nr:VOC family protein [Vicinamibacterales bacterium]